ncbi:MAG: hypothetical protein ABI675_05805 [Chitinophagaceae bacterium]
MRIFLVLTVFVLFCTNPVSSQTTETIRAKAGEDISKIISPNGIYRFPSFTTGTYVKNNNVTSSAKFNYNLFTREMQYLNLKGDTMTIANSAEINFIKIQDVVFYYRDGYKEVIVDHDSVKIAVESDIKLEYEKVGLYGQSNGAQEVSNMSSLNTNTNVFQLTLGQDAVIRKKTTYYLFNKNHSPVVATKKSFLKIFNKNKPGIDKYVEDYKINFNNPDDLKNLLTFCGHQ